MRKYDPWLTKNIHMVIQENEPRRKYEGCTLVLKGWNISTW
jgi:hypothetical protein